MKKLVFIFFLILFISNVYTQSITFTTEYKGISGSDRYIGDNSSNPPVKYFLIYPEGFSYNSIRFQLFYLSCYQPGCYLEIYLYDPETQILGSLIAHFDANTSDDSYNPYQVNGKAIVMKYYGGAYDKEDFPFMYEASNLTVNNYSYTDKKGTFEDGSGASNYSSNIKNSYLIKPVDSEFVELVFTDYALYAPDGDEDLFFPDNVVVYDGETENSPMIRDYDIYYRPISKITSTGKSLFLVFNTNSIGSNAGWAVEYKGIENRSDIVKFDYDCDGSLLHRTIELGSRLKSAKAETNKGNVQPQQKFEENVGNAEITIFPNPTHGELKVNITGYDLTQKTGIYIFAITGKMIKQISPVSETNNVDLSAAPNGTYVMRIIIGDNSTEWKVVKD